MKTSVAPAASSKPAETSAAGELRVYIGTYTSDKSKGIYSCRLDLATGKLSRPTVAGETVNPSFLALHPNGRFLYAVGEMDAFSGQKTGAVSAFSIKRATGKLTLLNQASSGGAGPCHLVVDHTGRNVLVANYTGGCVAVLPIDEDGSLRQASTVIQHRGTGADPQRQKGPHAHSVNLDDTNSFAFVADLGLDKVFVYRFDPAKGTLTPNTPPAAATHPTAGPRHFAFHPSGRFAYVINELDSTVTAFAYNARGGVLTQVQALSALPKGFDGRSYTAEVQVHPSGRFLYGSNRGHDSMAVFAIDPAAGTLKLIEHQSTLGKWPRHFGIDPTGSFLLAANQESDDIVVFRIHAGTGRLTPTGQTVTVPKPCCVKFLAAAPRSR